MDTQEDSSTYCHLLYGTFLHQALNLSYRTSIAEEIRNELTHQQVSVLTDMVTKKKYGIPSQTTSLAKKIYQILGKKHTDIPFSIN